MGRRLRLHGWLRCTAIAEVATVPVIPDTCPIHSTIPGLCRCKTTNVRLCRRWIWHRGPCSPVEG